MPRALNFKELLSLILFLCNVIFKGALITILLVVWCLNVLSFLATSLSISLWFETIRSSKHIPSPDCQTKKEGSYADAQFLAYVYLLDKKLEKSQDLDLF